MRLVSIKNYKSRHLNSMIKIHLGNVSINDGYVYIDDDKKIYGYCILNNKKRHTVIEWIYAKKGFGTEFLKRIEKRIYMNTNKIILQVSIDPNEKKETVIRRLNFYIKNRYRIFDIEYRKKYGPLLSMFKNRQE